VKGLIHRRGLVAIGRRQVLSRALGTHQDHVHVGEQLDLSPNRLGWSAVADDQDALRRRQATPSPPGASP
jgi:hypothetical protein